MEKNKIPTAEDFLDNYEDEYFAGAVFGEFAYKKEQVVKAMIEFAKLHVKAALEEASNNVKVDFSEDFLIGVNKTSILSAYPLNNMK